MPSLIIPVCILALLFPLIGYHLHYCSLVTLKWTFVLGRPCYRCSYWSSLLALLGLCLQPWWLCLGVSCWAQYKCHGLPLPWRHTGSESSFILVPFPFYSCIWILVLTTFPLKFSLLFRSMKSSSSLQVTSS